MRKHNVVMGLAAGMSLLAFTAAAQQVEIDYWQYVFDTRVQAMDQLIANFEEANPDITVRHQTFPYADYQTRVVAANVAGQGPDVVQLFYGWLDNFVDGAADPAARSEVFPIRPRSKREFFPIVSAMQRDGQYWGLPTAVRSLALFYNKDLFEAAGLDPENPPTTLDELVAAGQATVQRDGGGNMTSAGMALGNGRAGSPVVARSADPPVRRPALFRRRSVRLPTMTKPVLPPPPSRPNLPAVTGSVT